MSAQQQAGPASIRDALVDGMTLFEEELAKVGPDDWDRPTPCEGWTVEDLVRHTADTAARAAVFLRGETWAARESQAPPVEQWAASRDGLLEVLDGTELDVRWPLPADAAHGRLMYNGCDFVVHRWDLAVALGQEEELPAEWVALMDDFFRATPAETLRRPRAFHDPVDPVDGDGPTRRLMAFLGRRPLS